MNNNAWFKKENPFQTVIGFGGGATGFGAYSSASKTYVDDVFSPYVWTGTGSSRDISNGINLSGKGGMTWIKKRDGASIDQNNVLFDTERDIGGVPAYLASNTNEGQDASSSLFSAFNSDGFRVGTSDITNGSYSTPTYGSWSFRKQAGFFDVVTYTGNDSTQNISHSLGCVPGMIIIKRTDATAKDWCVYHRSIGNSEYLELNNTQGQTTSTVRFNSTDPTASVFSLGDNAQVNSSSGTYVAYLFAGGKSTAATARSVSFSGGTDEVLTTATSSDFDFGSGDFTVEAWAYAGAINNYGVVSLWNYNDGKRSWSISGAGSDTIRAMVSPDGQWGTRTEIQATFPGNRWNHLAFTRSGNTLYFFINGDLVGSASFTGSVYNNTSDGIMIGGQGAADDINAEIIGKISNVRIVKGTAVYTSPFKLPTEPLTNITNTKILCCNNSSVTGSTVTPGTITAHGSPTASTDSPDWDDTSSYVFGENEDQGIIKTGQYIGNGSATGPEVYLGWEPQYLLIKNTDLSSENWHILDNIRGIIATDTGDGVLSANTNGLELTQNLASLTSRGFTPKTSDDKTNGSGHTYIYMAIRRPDGYVGKLPSAGTDVFAMDTGNASPDIPTFDSGFPVDFAIMRNPASEDPNFIGWRLTGKEGNRTNSAEASSDFGAQWAWGSNAGWCANSNYSTGTNSWMWKRNSGFDVLEYTGDGVAGRGIQHSLNAVPEMLWIKKRNGTTDWVAWHSGLSSTSHYLKLNETNAEANGGTAMLNSTAPTSTMLTLGDNTDVNANTDSYMAMLFSSVEGISKVGSYTGNGTGQTITIGFQPRFIIIKRTQYAQNWFVLDTTRGWGSGNDNYILLNDDAAQASYDFGAPTSTGFTLTASGDGYNASSEVYVYYAHA